MLLYQGNGCRSILLYEIWVNHHHRTYRRSSLIWSKLHNTADKMSWVRWYISVCCCVLPCLTASLSLCLFVCLYIIYNYMVSDSTVVPLPSIIIPLWGTSEYIKCETNDVLGGAQTEYNIGPQILRLQQIMTNSRTEITSVNYITYYDQLIRILLVSIGHSCSMYYRGCFSSYRELYHQV
jgi:hypothetical protein